MVHAGSQRIAAVIGDPVQRELTLEFLRSAGHDVVLFENAEQAMACLESALPGLLIASVSAPRLEGWALCHRLRGSSREVLRRIPVLILSDRLNDAEAAAITSGLGGSGLLAWPVDRERFIAEVDRLLAGSASLAPENPGLDDSLKSASEINYRSLFECANDGIFLVDGAVLVDCNQKGAQLVGRTRAEIIGRSPVDFSPERQPDGRGSPEVAAEIIAAALRGESDRREWLALHSGGTPVHLEMTLSRVEVEGRLLVQAIVRDVTQHKQAEDALRQAEQQLRLLANNLHEAVLAYDMNRQLLFANPAVESLTGYSREELRRANFICWVHPDDQERMLGKWDSFFAGGACTDEEYRLIAKDGRERWVAATWGPLRDDTCRQVGVQGVERDITDRKSTEEALRESNERFVKAFQSAPVFVTITSLADGTCLEINDYGLQVTGFRREEVIGRTSTGIGMITPENRNRLLEGIDQRGRIAGLELPLSTKDGRTIIGLIFGEKIFFGQKECLLCVTLDVTEKKQSQVEREQLERQFYQSQKLESVGRLAGGMAHDFNNLLTVINGYSDLILSGLEAQDPLRDWLVEIREAGRRGAGLTRQLLAFSRKQVIQPQPVDLNEVILESRRMFERMVGEDVQVVTELEPEPSRVMADPGQLHQVLMNLVVNARDAMPAGGRLTLRSARVDLDAAAAIPGAAPGQYMVLEVSDTGVGMSEEIQQHAFEPFFTTKADRGTGLGLSTVYGIVRQAGGWITVESQPEMGATFRIGLPVLAGLAAEEATWQPRFRLEGTETILVVEDQDEVRRLAVALLKKFRYRVLEAPSGEEALLLAQSHHGPIHLLLTDVVMPYMTGRQLADRLTSVRPEVKVLYMSGYTADVIARQGVLEPGIEYVQKPFATEALALKVRTILGPPPPAARVLVVDDEEGIRRLFARILTSAGYDVSVASDGCQAQQVLAAGSYDLVITDLVMPNREGIETIQAIRKEYPKLKVIAVSGAFGGGFLETAMMLGAHDRLTKPVSPEQLLETVRATLAAG